MTHWTDFLAPDQPDGAYLSWKQVQPRVGISRTTAWRLQKAGEFPEPYVVSKGRVAYREREVEAWRASRARRTGERPPQRAGGPAAIPPAAPVHAAPPPPPPQVAPQAGPTGLPFADAPAVRPPRKPASSARRRPAPGGGEQITFGF